MDTVKPLVFLTHELHRFVTQKIHPLPSMNALTRLRITQLRSGDVQIIAMHGTADLPTLAAKAKLSRHLWQDWLMT